MKALPTIKPTPEQLPIIQDTKPGVSLIRGAAGSGKTTTALLRLRQLAGFWLYRRTRLNIVEPVRMLVITFNSTLKGYIEGLAQQQLGGHSNLDMTVSTFAKWASECAPGIKLMENSERSGMLASLGIALGLKSDFLIDEIDYILTRFVPEDLDAYLTCAREGRGTVPRVDRVLRQKLLDTVVRPYIDHKAKSRKYDWNDRAVRVYKDGVKKQYDVIIADEAQDLSANEVRAIMRAAADPSSVTFVLDAAQRIYPRGFTWKEAGVTIQPSASHRLGKNYRNTVETCRFALPLLSGLELGDDGTFPDFESCTRHGEMPLLLKGNYASQVAYAINYLKKDVNLAEESVAFLKPKGGQWFKFLETELGANSFDFVSLTRRNDWPKDGSNIGLCTMSSAKGLEFDHVIILGLNQEVTPHGDDPGDSSLLWLRRLLAMAVTRARKAVLIGFKPNEASKLTKFFESGTFKAVDL